MIDVFNSIRMAQFRMFASTSKQEFYKYYIPAQLYLQKKTHNGLRKIS